MSKRSYAVTLADGSVQRIGADSAAMVRRAYPDALRIKLIEDYTREPKRERIAWDVHSGRLPW